MIPYSRQFIDNKDIIKVKKVLKSNFLTQGPEVIRFEKKICNFVGAKFAIATNSATSALHIACMSIGLNKGDFVWTSPNSFVASANCAEYCGASVDFVDIDSSTFSISYEGLKKKIQNTKKNKLPKILIDVNFGGASLERKEKYKLLKKHGIKIIEDSSHCIGSYNKFEKIGSCKWSDISVFSFHPVKIITTGEGGMAITNNPSYGKKLKLFREHGITSRKKDHWFYSQVDLGYNYRMNEISAGLGISQLNKVKKFVKKRNMIADFYKKLFSKNQKIQFQKIPNNTISAYHLFVVLLPKQRDRIFKILREKGYFVQLHYIPIYRHYYYKKKYKYKNSDFPNTEKYFKNAISLPIYPNLNLSQVKKLVNYILKFYE
jgi:UDP-4-amino-4,6-dideoxy-N-acetyl-beta-L-altrosamine transaminase